MPIRALSATLQLASPALPIGAFSYSSGFESAIDLGWVKDAVGAQAWIASQCNEALLRWEIPLWKQLYDAWYDAPDHIAGLNIKAIAARESAELRSEYTQMGHALVKWCGDVIPDEIPAAQMEFLQKLSPVSALAAHALASRAMQLSPEEGALAYAFSFVENQVMAATKAIPLGQTAAQRMLRALSRNLAPEVAHALALNEQQWSSAAPLAAIASMKHETQYTRLFRS